jgi:hypothetical protein
MSSVDGPVHAPATHARGDAYFIGHAEGQDIYFTVDREPHGISGGYMLAEARGPWCWFCVAAAVREKNEIGRVMRRHAVAVGLGGSFEHPPFSFDSARWVRQRVEEAIRLWRLST